MLAALGIQANANMFFDAYSFLLRFSPLFLKDLHAPASNYILVTQVMSIK